MSGYSILLYYSNFFKGVLRGMQKSGKHLDTQFILKFLLLINQDSIIKYNTDSGKSKNKMKNWRIYIFVNNNCSRFFFVNIPV